jgi:hypothetical protein
MIPLVIIIATITLILAIACLRYFAHRQVATLFRSTIQELMSEGSEIESAMRAVGGKLVQRPPFKLLKDDELSFFYYILQDLGNPVEVGAEILQKCESTYNLSYIRDRQKMATLVYTTDLRLNLNHLIQDAELLHKKAAHQYPNLTLALLASLSVREGWSFIEENNDALVFDFQKKSIRIPKKGSGEDAARIILFEEMASRPLHAGPDTEFESRESIRKYHLDNFDSLFSEVFIK